MDLGAGFMTIKPHLQTLYSRLEILESEEITRMLAPSNDEEYETATENCAMVQALMIACTEPDAGELG